MVLNFICYKIKFIVVKKEENLIMAKNRYVGDYPVIGIRPIVDGRRGPMQLRESLEMLFRE